MRLLVVGDTHGNKSWVYKMLDRAVNRHCDALVQVGDFGFFPRMDGGSEFLDYVSEHSTDMGVPVYWIDGNHEDFDSLKEVGAYGADEMTEIRPNVTYIPRGHEWEWEGTKYLAMGGAYSIDRKTRVLGQTWWREELITAAQVEAVLDGPQVDVMFAHDTTEAVWPPPMFHSMYGDPPLSAGNRKAVEAIVNARRPRMLFHGHYHHCYVDKSNGTTVVGLGCDHMDGASAVLDANYGVLNLIDVI